MNPPPVVFLYVLIDPRTDEVRYVGETANPKTRQQVHKANNTHDSKRMLAWKAEMRAEGFFPQLRVLRQTNVFDVLRLESQIIAAYIKKGSRLVNGRARHQCAIKLFGSPRQWRMGRSKVTEPVKAWYEQALKEYGPKSFADPTLAKRGCPLGKLR